MKENGSNEELNTDNFRKVPTRWSVIKLRRRPRNDLRKRQKVKKINEKSSASTSEDDDDEKESLKGKRIYKNLSIESGGY